jgi:hypothetical protein
MVRKSRLGEFERLIAPMNLHVEELSHQRRRDRVFARVRSPVLVLPRIPQMAGSTREPGALALTAGA